VRLFDGKTASIDCSENWQKQTYLKVNYCHLEETQRDQTDFKMVCHKKTSIMPVPCYAKSVQEYERYNFTTDLYFDVIGN
jgi:hypothetical protein